MLVRIARLYPALVLGVLLGAVVIAMAPNRGLLWWPILQSLLLIPDVSAAVLFPLNAVLWSLFYEVCLNLVHAVAIRRLTVRVVGVVMVSAAVLFIVAAWRFGGLGLGWGGATFAAGFVRAGWGYAAGILIARTCPRLPFAWAVAAVAGAAFLLFAPPMGHGPVRPLATVFLIFPLAVIGASSIASVRTGVAAWLGGLSYPLYTTHLPLLSLAVAMLGTGANWPALAIALVLIAALIERLYDAPMRRLLKPWTRAKAAAILPIQRDDA